jgi:hypothetical protein
MILDRARINIKDNTSTRINNLSSEKQIHGKARNMRNIGNRKGGSRKGAVTSDKREVPLAARTSRGNSIEQRENNTEESKVI